MASRPQGGWSYPLTLALALALALALTLTLALTRTLILALTLSRWEDPRWTSDRFDEEASVQVISRVARRAYP